MPRLPTQNLDRLLRGVVEVIERDDLAKKLRRAAATGTPLRIKAGFDPTSPDLHVGHLALLRKLRAFQDAGHQVMCVVGDFTAMIGDPSGQTETRPPLTPDKVRANASRYHQQATRILDPKRTTTVFNSEWLSRLSAEDLIRLAATTNVARMLERRDFKTRMKEQRPLALHEVLYPLLQGHDSVALRADLELGGTDQTFNLLVGRDLQRLAGQPPQVVITMPLLPGLDGTLKMSKSYGNAIGFDDAPSEMFGKLMSIPDRLLPLYTELLTDPEDTTSAAAGPMEAKLRLAASLVAQLHDQPAADRARQAFDERFRARRFPQTPDRVITLEPGPSVPLVDLLARYHLVKSKSEARRLVAQGAIDINGAAERDAQRSLTCKVGLSYRLKIGKRLYVMLVCEIKNLDTPSAM